MICLSFTQTPRQEQILSCVSPRLMILGDLASLDPEDLEAVLEESLEDIRDYSRNRVSRGGNYFLTPHFGKMVSDRNGIKASPTKPRFSVSYKDGRLEITTLSDFSKLDSIYKKFRSPEASPKDRRNCFTRTLKEELDFISKKQKEIVRYVLDKQAEAVKTGKVNALEKITQEQVGVAVGLSASTVGRVINSLSIYLNGKEIRISDLITAYPEKIKGYSALLELAKENGGLKALFSNYSDEKIRILLEDRGIILARRTICKYKEELQNLKIRSEEKPQEEKMPEMHWYFDRPLKEEDIEAIVKNQITPSDRRDLETPNENWGLAKMEKTPTGYSLTNAEIIPTSSLIFFYLNRLEQFNLEGQTAIRKEVDARQEQTGYSTEYLDYNRTQ